MRIDKNRQLLYAMKSLENNPDGVFWSDPYGKILYVNDAACRKLNYSKEELLNMSIMDIDPNFSTNNFGPDSEFHQLASNGNIAYIQTQHRHRNGHLIPVDISMATLDEETKMLGCSFVRDITEQKLAENKLIEAESRYRSLLENAFIGVYLFQNNCLIYVNEYLEKITGYTKEDFYGMNPNKFIRQEDGSFIDIDRINSSDINQEQAGKFMINRKDGNIINVEIRSVSVKYNGEPATIGTILDITTRKNTEQQIRYMAYHDALTELPNRYALYDYLKRELNKGNVNQLGVLFIDLDRFKLVNDSLGHDFGDSLLKKVSERLSNCIRKEDVIFRYGGDEFVIIIKDNGGLLFSNTISQRIINELSNPFKIIEHEVYISPSIGISLYPQDGSDVETLLRNADTAMYHAKENGRNNYKFYTSKLNIAVSRKMYLENGLRKAIENNELILFFQPQVELKTGKIIGAEALVRWEHPELGMILPSEFITLAEETGLIIPIGEWVLLNACLQYKAWEKKGVFIPKIAVNVSGFQFKRSNFLETIRRVLKITDVEPSCLEIEFTESVFHEITEMHQIITELKADGIKTAIDDFGIGYSSLNLLKYLNVDILKIDPSFTSDLCTNPNSAVLLKFICALAHELNIGIIAEGIEQEEQAKMLLQQNCDMAQGYLFSRPILAKDIETFMAETMGE